MTRNKLALEQLRVEKQRLNEENESQARSKSNMKLANLCIIDMEQLFYNYYGAHTTSNPRAVPAATREKSGPTCEQHAWHIFNQFICVSLCAFVLLLLCVNCRVLSVLLSFLQPTRRDLPSLIVPDSQKEFWDRSIVTLLQDVHGFRTRVGQLFAKVGGSGRPSCMANKTSNHCVITVCKCIWLLDTPQSWSMKSQ